jgi:hypothetical protein
VSTPQMVRFGGLAGMLGGVLFAAAAASLALRPPGVVGGSHRESGDLIAAMNVAALFLVAGLAALAARQAGRPGAPARAARLVAGVGAAVAGGGIALTLLGLLGTAIGLAVPWWTLFLGLLGLCVGSALAGGAALSVGAVPRPAALPLVATAVMLFLFNTEDARALWAVPFGAAWVVLGYVLWSDGDERRGTGAADRLT